LLSANTETLLAVGVVVIVALLVMPLPPFLLDALLAVSFALSIIVLMITMSTKDPIEFSSFPSLLLLTTLFRLGLNVTSTRLILGTGHAGQVIAAFGNFVISGNVVVGLVIFLILVVINFVVITKGAGRIAEVAARFTLDAMPGRQMSIDADLGAGLIDEFEARRRREEINRHADFYGSMDGAAKFVRGDAIAALLITGINLIGGFIIGMTQRGMTAGEALTTYSMLTIGDGLVTQIPALIVSTAAGVLVTHGSAGGGMAQSMVLQLTRSPRALWTAAGVLGTFALVPGLPALPFLALAAGCGVLARRIARQPEGGVPVAAAADDAAPVSDAPAIREILSVEPLELEVGYGLVPFVDERKGGTLLQRVGVLRKQLAFELGMIVPSVRIRDNIQLAAHEYAVKMRGVRIGGGELPPGHLLAVDTRGTATPVEGIKTTDPSFGLPALWIASAQRAAAESAGWVVVEPLSVLSTHLLETIREHAADLLSRQHVREMLDSLKETHSALVEDLIPGRLTVGIVQRVLQRLLREGLPVRDLVTILEALSDGAEQTKDPEALAEHARRALAPLIANILAGENGTVRAISMGPRLEVALMQLFSPRANSSARTLEPEELHRALQSLSTLVQRLRAEGAPAPLVTPPGLRLGVRRLVEPVLPRLAVVSLAELPPQTPLQNLATWELADAA
jgi:flagellar biosynthesis protein FlhA